MLIVKLSYWCFWLFYASWKFNCWLCLSRMLVSYATHVSSALIMRRVISRQRRTVSVRVLRKRLRSQKYTLSFFFLSHVTQMESASVLWSVWRVLFFGSIKKALIKKKSLDRRNGYAIRRKFIWRPEFCDPPF